MWNREPFDCQIPHVIDMAFKSNNNNQYQFYDSICRRKYCISHFLFSRNYFKVDIYFTIASCQASGVRRLSSYTTSNELPE